MKGIYTALVTPFRATGEIDWPAFDRLLEQQRKQGVDGLVICGTTGESPTLSSEEKLALMKRALEKLQGSGLDLIAGTGSNSTEETVKFTREVEKLGYRRFLIVTPYYNKPSQRGLIAHFTKIADSISGEIVLYNVPGRTSVSLTAKTVAVLAGHPRIRAIKEATGNIAFLKEIQTELRNEKRELILFSGDDPTFHDFVKAGGVGTISVASHLLARPMRSLMTELARGNEAGARVLNERCLPIFQNLFIDTNPAPVKFCLYEGGLIQETLRLPLVPVTEEHRAVLRNDLSAWKWESGSLT